MKGLFSSKKRVPVAEPLPPSSTLDRISIVIASKSGCHLVVDDAETNRMLLKAMLEGKGIKVDTCANGKDALMRLEESGLDRYDVLWTDLKMPNIGGAELSQAFRSRGFKKFIVVLTGNMSDDSRVLCDKADVDLICLKPLRKKDLYDLPIMQLYK